MFDLDDTLIQCTKKGRYIVPKQTWHALRNLHNKNIKLCITSYNKTALLWVELLGLYKYIQDIFVGNPPRYYLIDNIIEKYPEYSILGYFDDREDNIEEVKHRYPTIPCFLVKEPISNKSIKIF